MTKQVKAATHFRVRVAYQDPRLLYRLSSLGVAGVTRFDELKVKFETTPTLRRLEMLDAALRELYAANGLTVNNIEIEKVS